MPPLVRPGVECHMSQTLDCYGGSIFRYRDLILQRCLSCLASWSHKCSTFTLAAHVSDMCYDDHRENLSCREL